MSVASASRRMLRAAWTASARTAARSIPKTTRRWSAEVELYRWTIARRAPRSASKVRSMSASRAGISTAIVTSSGTRSSSISRRTKSKSVCDALGNPTSISLNPVRTSRSQSRRLRSGPIGSTSAWLPSRRSTLHHSGARSIVLPGQRRSARSTGKGGLYLAAAAIFIDVFSDVFMDVSPVGVPRAVPPGAFRAKRKSPEARNPLRPARRERVSRVRLSALCALRPSRPAKEQGRCEGTMRADPIGHERVGRPRRAGCQSRRVSANSATTGT